MILDMQELEIRICDMLDTCKLAFSDECSNFSFYKFHMVLHCPLQIRQFGNLAIMDANRYTGIPSIISNYTTNRRFEETHKHFAKIPYELTPKRTLTLDADLFKAYEYIEKVNFACREVRRQIMFRLWLWFICFCV